jgi:hypothetical protein
MITVIESTHTHTLIGTEFFPVKNLKQIEKKEFNLLLSILKASGGSTPKVALNGLVLRHRLSLELY